MAELAQERPLTQLVACQVPQAKRLSLRPCNQERPVRGKYQLLNFFSVVPRDRRSLFRELPLLNRPVPGVNQERASVRAEGNRGAVRDRQRNALIRLALSKVPDLEEPVIANRP